MRKEKRYSYILTISVILVITLLLTYSYFPVFLRDRGELQEQFEYAQMYLTDDRYDELIIEIDHAPGYEPSFTAKMNLRDKINEFTDKEISIEEETISFQDTSETYRDEKIGSLTEDYQDNRRSGNTMVLHVLYLNGEWHQKGETEYEEGDILGLSYGGSHVIIFKEVIIESASKSPNLYPEDIESSVLVHEWAHILGLVGIGYESEHESQEAEHHCDSGYRCVMNATVEVMVGGFSKDPPLDFCVDCLGDIDRIKKMDDGLDIEEYLTFLTMGGELLVGVALIFTFGDKDSQGKIERTEVSLEPDEKKYY